MLGHQTNRFHNALSFVGRQYLRIKSDLMPSQREQLYLRQNENFSALRSDLRGTQIYKDLNLSEIKSYAEYVRQVPVWNYDDYAPYVDSLLNGNKHSLFNDSVHYCGLSSGTSGMNSKRVPYNEKMIDLFLKAQRRMAAQLSALEPHLNVLDLNRLAFGSAPSLYQENGINFGYISGILSTRVPRILVDRTFPSPKILEINDWDQKIKQLIEEVQSVDIQMVSGIPTYLISIFEALLTATGKSTIKEIWPNLRIFIYAATPIKQYQDRIDQLVGQPLRYYGLYAATEAPIGLPYEKFDGKSQKYLLNPDILYSFTPVNPDSTSAHNLGIHEIELGTPYFVNIGTPNGFIHYSMKDVISFSQDGDNLVFEFVGRKANGMNLAAEKVSDDEILECINSTKRHFNLDINHFFLSPCQRDGVTCYNWTLFVPENSSFTTESVAEFLDQALRKLNLDYDDCRQVNVLGISKVTLMSPSLIKRYFERNRNNGQFKMKTTFETSQDFEEFLHSKVLS